MRFEVFQTFWGTSTQDNLALEASDRPETRLELLTRSTPTAPRIFWMVVFEGWKSPQKVGEIGKNNRGKSAYEFPSRSPCRGRCGGVWGPFLLVPAGHEAAPGACFEELPDARSSRRFVGIRGRDAGPATVQGTSVRGAARSSTSTTSGALDTPLIGP